MPRHACKRLVVLSLDNMVREHFQFPLALEAGLAAILILAMAIVFVIACRRPLLQPAMLVDAIVQLVPLPCALDSQHLIQRGKGLADILVKHMA